MNKEDEESRISLTLGSMEAIGSILAVVPPGESLESGEIATLWHFMAMHLRENVGAGGRRPPCCINHNDNPCPGCTA